MEKIYLFLCPNTFTKIDWERFEVKYFLENNKVLIFDLKNILYPNLKKNDAKEYKDEIIFRFKNIYQFIKEFTKLIKKYSVRNICIINFVKCERFKDQILLLIISFLRFKIISFYNPGLPRLKSLQYFKNNNKKAFLYKKYFSFYSIKFIEQILFRYLFSFIINKKMAILGNVRDKKNILKKYPFNSFISGSSWDYSTFLRNQDEDFEMELKDINYAVHLDGCGPGFVGDEELTNLDGKYYQPEKVDSWYPKLNRFFKFIEETYNIKYYIAAHPRTNKKIISELYEGRKTFKNKTIELIKNASLVSTRGSTAISYAAIFKKPVVFLTSNLYNNWESFSNNQKCYLDFWDKEAINVDDVSYKKKFVMPYVDINKCKKYVNLFLSSNEKPNYFMIKQFFDTK